MRTTFAIGRTDRKATEVRILEGRPRMGGRRDGAPSFARSGSGAAFPGPWTVKAIIQGPKASAAGGHD